MNSTRPNTHSLETTQYSFTGNHPSYLHIPHTSLSLGRIFTEPPSNLTYNQLFSQLSLHLWELIRTCIVRQVLAPVQPLLLVRTDLTAELSGDSLVGVDVGQLGLTARAPKTSPMKESPVEHESLGEIDFGCAQCASGGAVRCRCVRTGVGRLGGSCFRCYINA